MELLERTPFLQTLADYAAEARQARMHWKTLSEDALVCMPWFRLNQAKVKLPDGRRIDHYLFRLPAARPPRRCC
jgi:hypothetical protein